MGKKKFWMVLIIITVIGLITLVVLLQKSTDTTPITLPAKPEMEIETDELDGITAIVPGTERGSYWELKFAKCIYRNNTGHLESIYGEFYNAKKTLLYRISAQTGDLYWKTRILKLKGNARLEAKGNAGAFGSALKELKADEMIWDPGSEKSEGVITARSHVTFTTQDLTVNTTQVKTDLDLKKMFFSGVTKASFHNKSR